MTIGEKIKYVRKLYHMSSAELAERTGIHPVSIRKYESNKMVPQSAQIERLAAAFHLSPAIFSGLTDMHFDFQYSGDCLGMLIMLYTCKNARFSLRKYSDNTLHHLCNFHRKIRSLLQLKS